MTAKFDEKVTAALAMFVIAMVPYAFTLLLYSDIPQTVRDIVMVLVGVIAANATQAVQHRFGSTPASSRKDDTISALVDTAKASQAALAPVLGAVTGTPPGAVVEVKPDESVTVKGTEAGRGE